VQIKIDYLKNHPHLVSEISKWFFKEWGYLYPERDLASVEEAVAGRMNYDKIPLALVAVSDNNFVGTVCLKDYDMETRKDISPWLAGLYVKEEFRNNGIGRLLVKNIIKKAKELGVDELYLYTPNAEKFYEKMGWCTINYEKYQETDVKIMRKSYDSPYSQKKV